MVDSSIIQQSRLTLQLRALDLKRKDIEVFGPRISNQWAEPTLETPKDVDRPSSVRLRLAQSRHFQTFQLPRSCRLD